MRHLLAVLLLTVAWSAQAANFGRQNYLHHCAGCHRMDGAGSPENGVPAMNGVVGHFLRLPEGRAFLVQVPGTSNAGLNDRQVAELLNWMLAELSPGEIPPGFTPYTAEEVGRYRADKPVDIPAARRDIVQRLNALGYAVK